MPEVVWAKTFSSPWWVVATVRHFVSSSRSMMARARAEPSSGSVPAPSSSRRTRLFGVGGLQDADDVRHVAAEGGKRLLDALLVADVRVDRVEDGQAAAGVGGNGQAGLGHGGQQADRLQGDRLAAGVGAGDQQHRVRAADR